ncbi:putative glycosyl transferase [Macrococcoides caseolyticum]|uniref:glycosyltransferase n=1 Tax=Macrococcoides caseolyticum TaxID=69966 RepID=UPI000DFDAEEE|nr:glycosyltransferase [Macrococcus caseolyticus]STY75982.1 putative glycosyl transferase [Macrococcus caseolyticus]
MRILNIVSSNVVTDPRVTKQLYTISSLTDDYLAIGKNNHLITKKSIEDYPYNYKLFGRTTPNESLILKIGRRIKFGIDVIRTIRSYKPDIIHANDFDVLFITALSGYGLDKVVFDAHEIFAKNSSIISKPIISKLVESLEKRFVRKTKSFITVSNAAKEYYIERGYRSPVVITNAPILEKKEISIQKNEEFEVVYQGQIVENRGYKEFLEAGKYIDDENIKLIIRGFGPLKHELVNKKNQDNINNVEIEQPVEMTELVNKLRESDVGVVLTEGVSANYEYTVSNKIFECIHAGLPVILSPVKEHIYLNNQYNFGLVIKDVKPSHIADAINQMKTDKELYNNFKKNAEAAAEIFTWQNESKKLKELYYEKK